MPIVFLSLDEVLALQADQISRYGGRPGLRSFELLQSAIALPAATFAGVFLHDGFPEMAAAYLFHIVRNHPFVDGNKRTGLMAMLAFLGLNGLRLDADPDAVVRLVTGVADGHTSKSEIAVFVKTHVRPRRARRRGR